VSKLSTSLIFAYIKVILYIVRYLHTYTDKEFHTDRQITWHYLSVRDK